MEVCDFFEILDEVGPALEPHALDTDPFPQPRRVEVALEELVDTAGLGMALDKKKRANLTARSPGSPR